MGNESRESLIHEQLVNQALIDHSVQITKTDLSEMCRIPVEDVNNAIQKLSDQGIIEVLGNNKYLINFAKYES